MAINAAGTAVIAVILLILAYLLYVALPLAEGVDLQPWEHVDLEPDQAYVVAAGDASLWRIPPIPTQAAIDSPARVLSSGDRALVQRGDRLYLLELVMQADRTVSSSSNSGTATLQASVEAPGVIGDSLAFHSHGEFALISYFTRDGSLQLLHTSSRGGDAAPQIQGFVLAAPPLKGGTTLLDASRIELIHIAENRYFRWRPMSRPSAASPGNPSELGQLGELVGLESLAEAPLVAWGPGHETVLLADGLGNLHRFDPARRLLPRLGPAIPVIKNPVALWSESRRRVTFVLNAENTLEILVPSSGDSLYRASLGPRDPGARLGLSSDGRYIYQLSTDRFSRRALNNRFPETGWRSLWKAHWYGAYEAPEFAWHPDGGSIGALSKYGLTPLLYGTFKAALYGLVLSIPLALGAAIYTGYFLSSRRRNQFKPAIEMLEAFPTVVLGFIAGLWLAPLLLDYLALVFLLPLLVIALPLLLALGHLLLQLRSPWFVARPPRVWLLTVVYLLALVGLAVYIDPVQEFVFQGAPRDWLWRHFGLRYDQRNALLVGLAMGIAITPAMFSIIEDAIFDVPRDLSDGSLALGATRWQTLARVVLPAASPAILSAILIGLARGLGETMIVLLATGNTPLLEGDMFSGLRSLSASITIELPEAGSESVHFRVLFLAALVLFGLTFTLNTAAELLRQRLRYAYASR